MKDESLKVTQHITLAEQSTRILRRFIRENYQDGGQIPGEHELAEKLGVNRNTLRQALKTLENEGIIIRKRGKGTFANKHVLNIRMRLDRFMFFSDIIRRAGYEPRSIQLEWGTELSSKDNSHKLDIELNSPLVRSQVLIHANDIPAIYVDNYIPQKLLLDQKTQIERPTGLFNLLEEYCNIKARYTTYEIIPRLCGPEIAEILEIDHAVAILQLNEIVYSEDNIPVAYVRVFVKDPIVRFFVVSLLEDKDIRDI